MTIISGNLDIEIIPLIHAMNNTGLLSTFSSCAGHNKDDDTYVSFYCLHSKIKKITKVISNAENELSRKGYSYEVELHVATGTKAKNGITLILIIRLDKEVTCPMCFMDKIQVIDIMTKHFLKNPY